MHQEEIGNRGQPFEGFNLARNDRLAGDVAAGRNNRKAELPHQQMMDRRVGQQHAEPRIAGRDCLRYQLSGPPQKHDRPRRPGEQRCLDRSNLAVFADLGERGKHHREGLVRPALTGTKPLHRRLVACIGEKMKSADPLQRDDRPLAQFCGRGEKRIVIARKRAPLRIP